MNTGNICCSEYRFPNQILSYAISKKGQFIRLVKLGLNKAMHIASKFFLVLLWLQAFTKIVQL